MTLVLLTLCLLCVRPAQAQGYGSWQVTASADETTNLDEFTPQGVHYHQEWLGGGGVFHRPNDWSDSAESKGTITCQFDYLDGHGSPVSPPFDHTWVKKTGYAFWHGNDNTSDSNGTASDGLGDPEIPTDDANGGTSSGTYYEKKDTGGGSFTVSASPQASVACSTSTNSSAETMGYESASFAAVEVGLPLVSSNIDASTKKGGAPNVRARDGSMTADCAATYDAASGVWRGGADLTCSSPFDDTLYTWNASGGTPSLYDETNNLGITSQFLSGISIDMGLCPDDTGLPMTTTVGPHVVSQSDPSASDLATYTITWHAPYEAYEEGNDEGGKDIIETRISGLWPSQMGTLNKSEGGTKNAELVLDGTILGFGLAGQEEIVGMLELGVHICHLTQFALDYAEEPEVNDGAQNAYASWHTAQGLGGNIESRWAGAPDGWTHCKMSWCRVAYWEDAHYNCDKYGPHGWIGRPYDCHAKQYTKVTEEPFFVDM